MPRRSQVDQVILARTGLFRDNEGRDFTICLRYRAYLDVRPSDLRVRKCQYPPHKKGDVIGERGKSEDGRRNQS